ncbi:MAG: hypothetical protein AAFX56_20300 [Pseudomonadota bacterium]
MNTLLAATTVFSLLAIYFVFATFRQLRRGRVLKAGGAMAGCVTTASVGGLGVVLAMSYLSYSRLTDEQQIGMIEFVNVGDDAYEARLMLDGERDRIVTLNGNEWQLDARVVSWKPPATVLGLDPIYKLERLSGRYTDIRQEQTRKRTVYALSEVETLDVWQLAQQFPRLLPGIDAYYGTATYLPMADGARYELSMSRDALIARPFNDTARDALGRWSDPSAESP